VTPKLSIHVGSTANATIESLLKWSHVVDAPTQMP
jgi:hypothetical protein